MIIFLQAAIIGVMPYFVHIRSYLVKIIHTTHRIDLSFLEKLAPYNCLSSDLSSLVLFSISIAILCYCGNRIWGNIIRCSDIIHCTYTYTLSSSKYSCLLCTHAIMILNVIIFAHACANGVYQALFTQSLVRGWQWVQTLMQINNTW